MKQNSRLSTIPYVKCGVETTSMLNSPFNLVVALATIINARISHGIASEAEHYADEYNAAFLSIES
jgi:hypothetical protein